LKRAPTEAKHVDAVLNSFEKILTVELGTELFNKAQERFKNHPTVRCWHGDSSDLLGENACHCGEPSLIWLDGHYSEGATARGVKDTPIMQELEHIVQHSLASRHVLLIDDARCFNGTNDYPTLASLLSWIRGKMPNHSCMVENDIIRVEPLSPDERAHRGPASIVVSLKGGLGNQMFQYAHAFALARKFNVDLHVTQVKWDTRLR
jgi:hypothetical protein